MLGRASAMGAVLVGAAIALGCTAQATANLSVKPGSTAKPTTGISSTDGLHVQVLAPRSLAASGASVIQGSDVAALATARGVGIVASGGGNIVAAGGGNIVASGGGNVVASGGGNIVAGGAGNYRLSGAPTFQLALSLDKLVGVAKALVFLEDLDGKLVSTTAVESTANGTVVIPQQFRSTPMLAVARFKVNGTTYQLSCPVGTAKLNEKDAYAIDPINTIIQGRIRQILNQNGAGAAVSPEELKAVWSVFNDAEVEVALDALKDGATLADLNAVYDQLIGKVPANKAQVVKDYMAKLRGIASARGDGAASADVKASADVAASGEAKASGSAI